MSLNLTSTHLFTRCLENKDVSFLRRINPEIFTNDIDQMIYATIFNYVERYHEVPSIKVVQEETSNIFVPTKIDVGMEYMFDKVTYELQTAYTKAQFNETSRPFEPAFLRELLKKIEVSESEMLIYNDIMPSQYFTDQVVLESNLPFITDNLGKIIGSDFIVFVGRMKNQKTHVSRTIVLDLLRRYNGLVFTNEITNLEYAAQLDAIVAGAALKQGFNPKVFRTLDETPEINEALGDVYQFRHAKLKKMMLGGALYDVSTLYSIINQMPFKPQFIVIDGAHLMGQAAATSGDKAQSLRNVSNNLKKAAVKLGIPVIAIAQSNRSREKAKTPDSTTIGQTDALAQDATAVFDTNLEEAENFGPYIPYVARITPIVNRADVSQVYLMTTNWNTMEIEFYKHKKSITDDHMVEDHVGDKLFEGVTETENEDVENNTDS